MKNAMNHQGMRRGRVPLRVAPGWRRVGAAAALACVVSGAAVPALAATEPASPAALESAPAAAAADPGASPAPAAAAPESPASLPRAGLVTGGTTSDQPFPSGTAGSKLYRIPAALTLENGWLMTAVDARYSDGGDGGGLDTLLSVSKDGGKTWEWSMPLYFPDSDGYAGTRATTIIDPVLTQGTDGTVYLMADVNPTGTTTMWGYTTPKAGTGFLDIHGTQRLVLTSSWESSEKRPDAADTATYEYYVGDPGADGLSPVLRRSDDGESGYLVDDCFNLYRKGDDGSVGPLTQKQVNNAQQDIQQNAFYQDSELHVYKTGYMWLARSTDNGATWKNEILNPQIKTDDDKVLLVAPGRGTVLSDGTVTIPFYAWDSPGSGAQHSTFIFSRDQGKTWHRAPNAPGRTSSECELVELPDGTLRMFCRSDNNVKQICYIDAVWNEQRQNYEWVGSDIVNTGVTSRSGCKLSAMRSPQRIGGKEAILVSAPSNPNDRQDGRVHVFTLNDDDSMQLAHSYHVNDGGAGFHYSCLTMIDDDTVGLLYEEGDATSIRWEGIPLSDIVDGDLVGDTRTISVPLYGNRVETLDAAPALEPVNDGSVVGIKAEEVTEGGRRVHRMTYTGISEGTAEFRDPATGATWRFVVTARDFLPVRVAAGRQVSVPHKGSSDVTLAADESIARVTPRTVDDRTTVDAAQGRRGKQFDSAPVPLSQALFTFDAVKGAPGTYTVSHTFADGSKTFLGLRKGQAGHPQQSLETEAGKISLIKSDSGPAGSFKIKSSSLSYNGFLYFYDQAANPADKTLLHTFGQLMSDTGVDQMLFQVYRPMRAGDPVAADAALAGYVQVLDADEIEDGGSYLIVAARDARQWALFPKAGTQSYNDSVIMADPAAGTVRETFGSIRSVLDVEGVAPGVTDAVVGGVPVRVTVVEPADEPTETIGANFPGTLFSSAIPDNTFLFDGGRSMEGGFRDIRGARGLAYHFEEYARWNRSTGSTDWNGRQRFVFNVGKDGQTLADSLAALDERVAAVDPKVVTYLVGAEDYRGGAAGVDAFKANLKAYVQRVLALRNGTGMAVVMTSPLPATATPEDRAEAERYSRAVREVLYDLGDADRNVLLIDCAQDASWSEDLFSPDGAALSATGQLKMARALIASVARVDASQLPGAVGPAFPDLVEVAQPESYSDREPSVSSTADALEISVPDGLGADAWDVEVATDGFTLRQRVTGDRFRIADLPAGASYTLTLTAADMSVRLPVMAGTVGGGAAARAVRDLDANQRAIADLAAGDKSLTWLFMGDSITHGALWTNGYDSISQGFEKFLRDDLGRVDDLVINTGVSNATTRDTLENLQYRLDRYEPDVVSIMLGTNDASQPQNIDETAYKTNLRALIAAAKAKGARVVLRTPVPDQGNGNAVRRAYAGYMAEVAGEYDDVILIDQYGLFEDATTKAPYLSAPLYGNAIHPSAIGQLELLHAFIDGTGLARGEGYLENLAYRVGAGDEAVPVEPAVTRGDGALSVDLDALLAEAKAAGHAFDLCSAVLTATDADGRQFSVEGDGTGVLELRNLSPYGNLTVKVSGVRADTGAAVSFADAVSEGSEKPTDPDGPGTPGDPDEPVDRVDPSGKDEGAASSGGARAPRKAPLPRTGDAAAPLAASGLLGGLAALLAAIRRTRRS